MSKGRIVTTSRSLLEKSAMQKKVAKWQTKHKLFQLERKDAYFRKQVVNKLDSVLSYDYFNIYPELAWHALTHCSYYEHLNQEPSDAFDRLAFMGDSVLKVLAAGEFIDANPDCFGGRFIFTIPAKDIDPKKLACRVVEHGLHYYLRHRAPSLMDEIYNFEKCMHECEYDELPSPPDVLPQIANSIMGGVYLNRMHLGHLWRFTARMVNELHEQSNQWMLIGHCAAC